MLARKDHLFIDPLTDEAWEFPQIPRSAFPEAPIADKMELVSECTKKWQAEKVRIIDGLLSTAKIGMFI